MTSPQENPTHETPSNPEPPSTPNEPNEFRPDNPTEVNPGEVGTNTEIDLDKTRINTYEDRPQEH